jgi:Rieske Fe-S protein
MLDLDIVRRVANGPAPHPLLAANARIVSDQVLLQLIDEIEAHRAKIAKFMTSKAVA